MYERFFEFAYERHSIYLARQRGEPRPWTEDPVLDTYRFTNVYRELDATTIWFADKVREPIRMKPEVLLVTVLFRWFNRIATGEAIFLQCGDYTGSGRVETAWDCFLRDGNVEHLKGAILQYCGDGPYVTGAYIIKTPDGMNKLDGVLQCVEWFNEKEFPAWDGEPHDWRWLSEELIINPGEHASMEYVWGWLRQFPFLGDFMAYEIVTDLRHTDLLCDAPDIMTWANPGPGAMRGLNRINGREIKYRQSKQFFIDEMRDILQASVDFWPDRWPKWEMREVEHTLCEFDKYERARLGEGRPRGVYR